MRLLALGPAHCSPIIGLNIAVTYLKVFVDTTSLLSSLNLAMGFAVSVLVGRPDVGRCHRCLALTCKFQAAITNSDRITISELSDITNMSTNAVQQITVLLPMVTVVIRQVRTIDRPKSISESMVTGFSVTGAAMQLMLWEA